MINDPAMKNRAIKTDQNQIFKIITILSCGHPTLEDFEDFEDSDFEEPLKLPSRALNWQKSNISFLILNNLTFGFYFCGDNNPIVLKQLNSEVKVLRLGFATKS